MKAVPGTLQEGGASFQMTHWTVVLEAGQREAVGIAQRGRLGAFCRSLLAAHLTHFCGYREIHATDAKDWCKGFQFTFCEKNARNMQTAGEASCARFLCPLCKTS